MTRLVNLQPAWLSPDVFIFRNPTGGTDWLTCKRVAMSREAQYALIYRDHPEYVGKSVAMTVPEMAWAFSCEDFDTLTVWPSVDHSPSGNWHGFITDGAIS